METTSKICWIDTETTGLDSVKHAIIQIAALIEINGQVVEEFEFFTRPRDTAMISPEAMRVNGRTLDEIADYPPPGIVLAAFKKKLKKYVNPFDKLDKFVPAGKNVVFDTEFLRQFFLFENDNYYGSWFTNVRLEVESEAAKFYLYKGLRLPNFKLSTLCAYFGIPLDAHDAKSDIRATRQLYLILQEELNGRRKII